MINILNINFGNNNFQTNLLNNLNDILQKVELSKIAMCSEIPICVTW